MTTIQIDAERCKGCGTCVSICPLDIFTQSVSRAVPTVLDTAHCIECGHCVAICPNGAIAHSAFPADRIHPIQPERLPGTEQLIELLRSRRSVREFRSKPVKRALIEQMINGARFAPSAHNAQSTQFLVIQDQATLNQIVRLTIDQLRRWCKWLNHPLVRLGNRLFLKANLQEIVEGFATLVHQYEQGTDGILYGAPVLVLFHGDRHAPFAATNAHLAVQNASLVCETLGLGAFYTGFVLFACKVNRAITRLLSLPPHHRIYGGLAIGYPRFHYHHWIDRNPAHIQWM